MIPAFWFRWLYLVIFGIMLFGASMVVMPKVTRDLFSLLFAIPLGAAILKGWLGRVWAPGVAYDHATDFGRSSPDYQISDRHLR